MQGLLDARAVVFAEFAHAGDDGGDVVGAHRRLRKIAVIVGKARFRQAAQVEDDFDKVFEVRKVDERLTNGRCEDVEECVEFPVA